MRGTESILTVICRLWQKNIPCSQATFIRTDFRHVQIAVFALVKKSLNCWTGKAQRKIDFSAKWRKTFGKTERTNLDVTLHREINTTVL